jgi:hypothetical protein
MCDVDNMMYAAALSERTRVKVEKIARIQLTDRHHRELSVSKAIYIMLVPATVVFCTWTAPMWSDVFVSLASTFVAFLIGSILEALVAGGGLKVFLTLSARSFGSWFVGFISFMLIFLTMHG